MELNKEKIERSIVEAVVHELIDEDSLTAAVRSQITAKVNALFEKTASAVLEAEVANAIKGGFEHVYYKVNSFGNQDGPPTTVRKELEKLIQGYWNQPVDKNGKASSFGAATRAEYVMSRLISEDFNDFIKQQVVNVGGAFKDKCRESLYETVNEVVSSVFKVKSLGDQGKERTGTACINPPVTKE